MKFTQEEKELLRKWFNDSKLIFSGALKEAEELSLLLEVEIPWIKNDESR